MLVLAYFADAQDGQLKMVVSQSQNELLLLLYLFIVQYPMYI